MKDDKLKGKSQKDQAGQRGSDSKIPPFQKTDEDVDFEILDALEQIEQADKGEERLPQDESIIDLTLDEGEIIFEEDIEQESGFRFDESVAAGVEEELTEKSKGFSLEEEPPEIGFDQTDTDLGLEDAEFSVDIGIEEGVEDISSDIDLAEFSLDSIEQEDSFQSEEMELLSQEDTEVGLEETEEDFGEMGSTPDFGPVAGDESMPDEELPDLDFAGEPDEFSGKPVIAVGADQVIDLGDETEFDQEEEFETTEEFWENEEQESGESFDIPEEEETGVEIEGMGELIDSAVASLEPEEDQDEEFRASLEDIDIDLGEETAEVLETSSAEDISGFAEEESPEFDLETPDITIGEEEKIGVEILSEAGEESQELEMTKTDIGETAEVAEAEIDEREELGLTPRLADSEVNTFESMVNQAKTLQNYVEALEKYKAEIKERIYQKLLKEYTSRKTDIFNKPEFLRMQVDIEQDLQDMLTRRTEFVSKIDRLNEELEEVKVRHLVGEYSDTVLSEREETQQTEIAQWHNKTEKIEKFIARYQELLDTERGLNPLRQESTMEEAEEEVLSEQETIPIGEEISQEEEVTEEISQAEIIASPEHVSQDMEIESQGDTFPDEITEEWGATAEDIDTMAPSLADQEFSAEEMISCKKCGRATPVSETFCINCGAKAR
jgi:hypothetical protein